MLKLGVNYRFVHERKGVFIARFIGEEPGDEDDQILYRVVIQTGSGSGQERLANAFTRDAQGRKVTPDESEKLIRPSLLLEVTDA